MSMDLMLRLGQSKMEKLQESFVMTDKETGKEIISKYGADAFAMWWYVEGLCFGKDKVTAFPKKETIATDLGVSLSTVQRWLKKLEKIKAIKRVSLFNKTGAQTSNLLIINAAFPEIPGGWDELYQYGAYQLRRGEYRPLKNAEEKPWSNLNTLIKQLKEKDKKDVETQENSPGQICTGPNDRVVTSDQGGCADLHRGGSASGIDGRRDKGSFFEREEEEVEKDSLNIYIQDGNDRSNKAPINTGYTFYNWLDKDGALSADKGPFKRSKW